MTHPVAASRAPEGTPEVNAPNTVEWWQGGTLMAVSAIAANGTFVAPMLPPGQYQMRSNGPMFTNSSARSALASPSSAETPREPDAWAVRLYGKVIAAFPKERDAISHANTYADDTLVEPLYRGSAPARETTTPDTERLDWLETGGCSIRPTFESPDHWLLCDDSLLMVNRESDVSHYAPTVREVIDRARSERR